MIFIIINMPLSHLSVLINNSFNILHTKSGLNMLNINQRIKHKAMTKHWWWLMLTHVNILQIPMTVTCQLLVNLTRYITHNVSLICVVQCGWELQVSYTYIQILQTSNLMQNLVLNTINICAFTCATCLLKERGNNLKTLHKMWANYFVLGIRNAI